MSTITNSFKRNKKTARLFQDFLRFVYSRKHKAKYHKQLNQLNKRVWDFRLAIHFGNNFKVYVAWKFGNFSYNFFSNFVSAAMLAMLAETMADKFACSLFWLFNLILLCYLLLLVKATKNTYKHLLIWLIYKFRLFFIILHFNETSINSLALNCFGNTANINLNLDFMNGAFISSDVVSIEIFNWALEKSAIKFQQNLFKGQLMSDVN